MERDPKLRELAAADYEKRANAMSARHKELPAPRSMDTLIGNVKGYAALRKLQQKSCEAGEKLVRAQAGMLELSDQETKDALRDMMKFSVMDSSYQSQTRTVSDQASDKFDDIGNSIYEKYAGHETLSALAMTGTTLLHSYYVDLAPKGKTPVLETLRDHADGLAASMGGEILWDEPLQEARYG